MRVFRILGRAGVAFWEDNAMRLGASVAYYTLFAIAPILLIVIAIAGMVFGAEAVRGEVVGQLDQLLGQDGAEMVQAMLKGAAGDHNTWIAMTVGIVTLVLASTGAFLELQAAFNTIWRVVPAAHASIAGFLLNRLQSFGLVVAIGFLLLVSLAASAALGAFEQWMEQMLPAAPLLLAALTFVVSFAVSTGLFALLYRFLPDTIVPWRDAAVGGAMTAALFTVGKHVIGFYLGRSVTASAYGAAGSLILLLLWVYYSSQIVLLGAEFTRLWTEDRLGAPSSDQSRT